MRLAVIADIHGNLDALEAVLQDLRTLMIDRLYINGDVVNRGPDSVACMERVLTLSGDLGLDAEFTLGNHDDLMLLWHEQSPLLPSEWLSDPFWGATAWSAGQLHAADLLAPIRRWPMSLRPDLVGLPQVVIAHGSPQHYREAIGLFTTPERGAELLSAQGAGVLVASHIHRPMLREQEGDWLINTGAVGAPFDGDPRARYLLLEGVEGVWTPSIRAVPYDRAGVLGRFETSGLLARGGLSARIFLEEIRSARSLYTPFWDWTAERGLGKDDAAWAIFRREHPDLFLPV
ncbi:metallophosphoesterase family protein [Deinococcus sp.]|uniref:metallophosphoesterase family protein n=1 Tax=Deinococcus sp. TaxID=47478 RepID=UPI003C7BB01D